MITQARLHQLLDYNSTTGVFVRRVDWYGCPKGSVAGTTLSNGYLQIRLDGKKYLLHRLAWMYVYGVWPVEIDHIDGIRNHNAIANLRNVCHAANQQNMSAGGNRRNTSGHAGVSWHKHQQRWVATITVNNKTVTVGSYADIECAVEARADAKAAHHKFVPEARP